jgi:hypothetical protein
MVNTKAVVLLIALSVVVAAIAGIAFAQYASAQANAVQGVVGQLSQGGYNGYNQTPQQGYYPTGGAQCGNSYSHGYGMGNGICGRFR